jgi:hypothetical protein
VALGVVVTDIDTLPWPPQPAERQGMSERRFALVDFTHMNRAGCLRLYEAGHTYTLSQAIAHAAIKRELVAKQRPSGWTPPSMFRHPEVLTGARLERIWFGRGEMVKLKALAEARRLLAASA